MEIMGQGLQEMCMTHNTYVQPSKRCKGGGDNQ